MNDAIKIVNEVEQQYNNGWIPCNSGVLPEECRGVEVTIMEDANEVGGKRYYTQYSWLQDGRWIFKKTPYNPIVIAWRYPIPYIPNGEKRYTNADRIRAMTDKQLADAIIRLHIDDCVDMQFCQNSDRCQGILDSGEEIPKEMCRQCLMEWLKRDANA